VDGLDQQLPIFSGLFEVEMTLVTHAQLTTKPQVTRELEKVPDDQSPTQNT